MSLATLGSLWLLTACTSAPDTSSSDQNRDTSTTTSAAPATTTVTLEATTTSHGLKDANTSAPDTGQSPDVALGPNRFLELLGAVADTPENRREIFFADVTLAAASVGVEAPDQDQDHLDYYRELGSLEETSLGLPSPQVRVWWWDESLHVEPEIWLQTYGWTPGDVASVIEVGSAPVTTTGIQTRRSGDQITEALLQSTVWPAVLTLTMTDQGQYFRSGEDGAIDLDGHTELHPLGRSERLVIGHDGTVLVTPTDESVQQLLEVESGDIPSLAENPAIRFLAEAMHDRQMSSVYLFNEPFSNEESDGVTNHAPRALVYGLGYGVVDGERRAVWSAHYETKDQALSAQEAVLTTLASGQSPRGDAWSANVRVLSSEIRGTTVEIVVEPETMDVLLTAAWTGNELFATSE